MDTCRPSALLISFSVRTIRKAGTKRPCPGNVRPSRRAQPGLKGPGSGSGPSVYGIFPQMRWRVHGKRWRGQGPGAGVLVRAGVPPSVGHWRRAGDTHQHSSPTGWGSLKRPPIKVEMSQEKQPAHGLDEGGLLPPSNCLSLSGGSWRQTGGPGCTVRQGEARTANNGADAQRVSTQDDGRFHTKRH